MRRLFLSALPALVMSAAISVSAIAQTADVQRVTPSGKVMSKADGEKRVSPLKKYQESVGLNTEPRNRVGIQVADDNLQPVVKASRRSKIKTKAHSATNPRGTFFGNVVSFSDMVYYDQAYWGQLDAKTGFVTPIYYGHAYYSGASTDYQLQGGAVRDGIFYTPHLAYDFIEDATSFINWNRIDLATGDVLTPIRFYSDEGAAAYTIAYDPINDIFHCMGFDESTGASVPSYYQIDAKSVSQGIAPSTIYKGSFSKATGLVNNDEFIAGFAYCPADNRIYAISDYNMLYTLSFTVGNDGKTASLLPVGEIDYSDTISTKGMATQIVYSPLDNAFLIYYRNELTYSMQLLFLDPETLEISEGVEVEATNPYFAALYCPDPYAKEDAPEQAATPVISFDGPATSGTLTFTVPTIAYSGVELTADKLNVELTVDGNSLFSGQLAKGATQTVALSNMALGLHTAELTTSVSDELVSPVRTTSFWVGYDNPNAPTNLKLSGLNLSWKASKGGAHDGYVNADNITYDVYLDDEKQNSEPITTTSFALVNPSSLKMRDVKVVANADGMASEPASLSAALGKGQTVPYTMAPSAEEAELFTIIDGNNDGTQFDYYDSNGNQYFGVSTGYRAADKDEWLILPKTAFEDISKLYSVSFSYMNANRYQDGTTIEIYMGKTPTVGGMTKLVYSRSEISSNEYTPISANFAVAEEGEYYLGIHFLSTQDSGGAILSSFSIQSVGDSSVPGEANVTFTPGEKGALNATVSAVLPTVDLVGKTLAADGDVTLTVNGGEEQLTLTGKPGATVTGTVTVADNGWKEFEYFLSNASGSANKIYKRIYVGLDRPQVPRNIVGTPSSDNKSMTLTWDNPGSVGANGGYVDVDNLEYQIYLRSSVNVYELGKTSECSYSFTPDTDGGMDRFMVGPVAMNEVGESDIQDFVSEILGEPYTVPMVEEFSTTGNTYSPWYYASTGKYDNTLWDNFSSITIDHTTCSSVLGGYEVYSVGGDKARLLVPKIKTTNSKALKVEVRYWAWKLAPNMHLYARWDGHNEEALIVDWTADKSVKGQWKVAEVDLPEELYDKNWVQFFFDVDLTGASEEYGVFDSFSVVQDIDTDLKLESLTGPGQATISDNVEYLTTVVNSGKEPFNGGSLAVELLDNNNVVVDRMRYDIPRITANQTYEVYTKFDILRDYLNYGDMKVRATVSGDDDEVEGNNSAELDLKVVDSQLPSVNDLAATWNDAHDAVTLSWSEPDLTYGDREDWEIYKPFVITDHIGRWKNIDRDGLAPFIISGLNWENASQPQAWHVIDAKELGIMNDSRLAPHSGSKYIMARQPSYDEDLFEDDDEIYNYQAHDWLISPEIEGNSTISFWINSISVDYTEYVYLYYSTTDDNPESFTKLRSFSKSGEATWEYVSYRLPKNAKYVALEYTSIDSFGAMIDDICITPAQLDSWVVDHYKLYRYDNYDWNTYKKVADNITATSYTDDTVGDNNAAYMLYTVVKSDDSELEGPRSNIVKAYSSGVDEITNLEGIYGGKGEILVEGHVNAEMALYTTDGKFVKLCTLNSDAARVACDAGIYLVKIGNAYAKVIVR